MNGATEFLGLTKALEGGLTDYVCTTFRKAAIGVGQQGTILVGEEEARGNCIDTYARRKLLGNLVGQEGCEIADTCLC